MDKHNQVGAINVLLIPFVLALIMLIGAVSFGGWAYSSRQDFKTNTDQKIAAAVAVAKEQESTSKDLAFAEAQKQPLVTYNGPQAAGSIAVSYPKTWSAYVDDTGANSSPVDAYFNPGHVPAANNQNSTFALRVQILSSNYKDVLNGLSSNQKQGKITVAPYSLKKVPSVVGVIVTGTLQNNLSGVMVILPLRSTTLEIYTEGDQYLNDFNTNILPNFSFSP